MEMGFLLHIFAKQKGAFPWHPCPQGIKLLRAVIVSLFHKVGIFCDVQILFLCMSVCNAWTQHLLCILMRLNRSQRQSTVGPDRAVCWAPWGTWQHGGEVIWTRRAGSRQTRCFGAVKVIVSTYGLSWIQVLSWSPLWSPLYFTAVCWQLSMDMMFVCKCRWGNSGGFKPRHVPHKSSVAVYKYDVQPLYPVAFSVPQTRFFQSAYSLDQSTKTLLWREKLLLSLRKHCFGICHCSAY